MRRFPQFQRLVLITAALGAAGCTGGADATGTGTATASATAIATATADRNKALVKQWIEDIDRAPNPVDTLDKWLTPDFKAEFNGVAVDMKAYRELMAGFVKAFSKFEHDITYLVAEGDQVALGMKVTMTHSGEYEGLAATGKRVSFVESGVVRVRDGKIAEERAIADLMSLDQQLRAPAGPKK